MKFIQAFDDLLEKLSRWGIVVSLFMILSLSVLAIVLRWMGSSLMWIEPMVRHLVFLSAFFGGSLATSKGVHIKVDLLTHLVDRLDSRILKWFHHNLVLLFSFVICVVLTKSAWDFYLVEKEFGIEAFLGLHSSVLVGIIPFGMGLMALRFFNKLLLGLAMGEVREHHSV